jgi:uncharacterized protein with HEPN domain
VNKDQVLLRHIKDEIDFINGQFPLNNKNNLLNDPVLQRATIRSFEIIGEAVKNLSDDFKDDNPKIKWKEIAGMRDKLIHHYFGVDWDIVWEVINTRIPEREKMVEKSLE